MIHPWEFSFEKADAKTSKNHLSLIANLKEKKRHVTHLSLHRSVCCSSLVFIFSQRKRNAMPTGGDEERPPLVESVIGKKSSAGFWCTPALVKNTVVADSKSFSWGVSLFFF